MVKVDVIHEHIYGFDSEKLKVGVQEVSEELAKNLISRGAAKAVESKAKAK